MKKVLFTILAVLSFSAISNAQSLGVSYAYSSTAPVSGLSAHFESSIVSLGVVSLNSRLRGTMFSEKDFAAYKSVDVLTIDVSVLAKVSIIPMVNPYGGLGIAYEKTDVELAFNLGESSQTEYPLYITVGAEFSPIPFIKPFIEYRLRAADLKEVKNAKYDSDRGIVAIGVAVSF